jgi:hypothetical protein
MPPVGVIEMKTNKLAIGWILALTASLISGQPAIATEVISRQVSPLDRFTPERIESSLDILWFEAVEQSTSEDSFWHLRSIVAGPIWSFQPTRSGLYIFGFELDLSGDGVPDLILRTNGTLRSAGKEGITSARAEDPYVILEEAPSGRVVCEGDFRRGDTIVNAGGFRLYEFAELRIAKKCLPIQAHVHVSAFATHRDSLVRDRVPDFGFVRLRQPWVDAAAHLKGHGPAQGEFKAWTSAVGDGRIKFYVKYPQVGEKIQFLVERGGAYEEIAWARVGPSDLTVEGSYAGLQNHVYFIRTLELQPGKNRVRITVNGEIVWGTKTYVLRN